MEEQYDWSQFLSEMNMRLRDLEEKNRNLSERLLLIGQNLIEQKEENNEKFLEIRKSMEKMKSNTERMISFIETASGEFAGFARKDDLEILAKQVKIFQPFVKEK